MTYFRLCACALLLTSACASAQSLAKQGDQLSEIMFSTEAGKSYRQAVRSHANDPLALTGLASWYLRQGQSGKAALLLSSACSAPNPPARSWDLYARLLYREGQHDASNLALSRGLTQYPNHPDLLVTSTDLTRSRRIRQAQTRLEAFPHDTKARHDLALDYLAAGWTTLGLAEASILVQRGQASAQFLMTIVRELEQRRKTDHLTIWLEHLLAADYRNAHALERLSGIAIERDDLWRANSYISTYLHHYPENAAMLERGGQLSIRLGKHDEGKRWLEKAWAKGRRTHALAETLGHIALNHGKDQSAAERWFEAARQLQPDSAKLRLTARMKHLENQRLKQFADFYGREDHRLASILLRLAENSNDLGEFRTALEYANRVIESRPNDAAAYLIRARAELALSRTERSRASLAKARSLDPNNPLVWWYFSELEKLLENPAARLEALRKAAKLAPNEPKYCQSLASVWLARNDIEEALVWYRKAANLTDEPNTDVTIRSLERTLIERDLASSEASARGNRDDLVALGLRYRKVLGQGHEGSYRCLAAASTLDPTHAGLHVLTADAAIKLFFADMRHQLLVAARTHLEAALALEPENTDALAVKAALRIWELEQPGDMETVITKLTSLDRITNPLYYQDLLAATRSADEVHAARWYLTGKIMYNKNQDPSAALYLQQALDIASPDTAGIARALGGILRSQGDLEGAVKAYERLLAVPNLPGYHEYAITSLIIGNLHAEMARTFPRRYADFQQAWPAATNAQSCLETASQVSLRINQSLTRARYAYQGYIQRSAFDTHKSRGQNMVAALNDIPSDETAAIRRLAAIHLEAGHTTLAREILHLAITSRQSRLQAPALRSLMSDLASLLSREGQVNEANAIWADIIARFPDDWRSHHAHARYLFASGDIAKTILSFEKASRLSPRDKDIRTALGFLYWKNNQAELAVKALEDALALDEDDLHALYYMSRIELERGNLAQAVARGEQMVGRFKRSMGKNYADEQLRNMLLDTLATLARASFRAGTISKALEYIWEGIDLDKADHFGFLALAGDIRILQKKHEEAEQFYARAVRADPGNALYHFKWAQAMAGSEKEEQAIRLLDVLWKEGASFIRQHDVHLVYAQVLARQGHRKMAQTVLESMVESMPWLESGYIALARKLADDGKLAEAINVLEKGLNHIRTAPSVRDALAWYLASRGKSDLTRARNLALENVTLYPNSVEYRATLGYILLTLGLPASAVTSADPATLHARASARQPAAELGTTIAAAERHFAAGRWDQALELIAAGEGSREIISSENAAQAVFRMILAKSSPPHEFSPY